MNKNVNLTNRLGGSCIHLNLALEWLVIHILVQGLGEIAFLLLETASGNQNLSYNYY